MGSLVRQGIMAYGKNKLKMGKKGAKKKQQDPFIRKNWYDVKAPTYLNSQARRAGRTCVTKTTGQRLEETGLRGRVAEFNLVDLVPKNEDSHKKLKLEVQDLSGRSCLCDFHGLSLTRDKMQNMAFRKRRTLIDTKVDVKTTDGYVVRLFVIAFTKQNDAQVKVFTYAQSAQVKKIRKKITGMLAASVGACSLKEMVNLLISDKLESDIKSGCQNIFPLDPVHVHKVKLVRKPKTDFTKLMEIHDGGLETEGGIPVDESEAAKNLLAK